MSIAPAIALTIGPIGAKLSDQILINIPIPTSYYWMMVLGIGLLLRIIFRNNKRPDSKNIIAIYHAKLKPLKRYYVIKALVVWIMAIIVIFFNNTYEFNLFCTRRNNNVSGYHIYNLCIFIIQLSIY